jgi:hypothetical protein
MKLWISGSAKAAHPSFSGTFFSHHRRHVIIRLSSMHKASPGKVQGGDRFGSEWEKVVDPQLRM